MHLQFGVDKQQGFLIILHSGQQHRDPAANRYNKTLRTRLFRKCRQAEQCTKTSRKHEYNKLQREKLHHWPIYG